MRVVNVLGWVCAFAALGACTKGQASRGAAPKRVLEVNVITLAPAPFRDTQEYLGALISRQSVQVLPQVDGYVRRIAVRPGQTVAAGDVLLEVDARKETAQLRSAEANRRSVHSTLELARQTLVRTRALYKEGLVSAQELERAQAAAGEAEAASHSAEAQVSEREVQVQYHALRAPFAGTVGDILVRLGEYVTTTTVLTSIAQGDILEVNVAVPPERARTVNADTSVEILDRDGRVLIRAPLYFVAPEANPRTQLVDLKALFRNTARLRPSELVRTRVVYGSRMTLQVPTDAIVRQSGQAFVFLMKTEGGKTFAYRHPVTLGTLGEHAYVVDKGLSAGQAIAVSGLQVLRDRAPVKAVHVRSGAKSADVDHG